VPVRCDSEEVVGDVSFVVVIYESLIYSLSFVRSMPVIARDVNVHSFLYCQSECFVYITKN
jgi:hypothetical protein